MTLQNVHKFPHSAVDGPPVIEQLLCGTPPLNNKAFKPPEQTQVDSVLTHFTLLPQKTDISLGTYCDDPPHMLLGVHQLPARLPYRHYNIFPSVLRIQKIGQLPT